MMPEYFSQFEHDNRSDGKESCILHIVTFLTLVAKPYSPILSNNCVHLDSGFHSFASYLMLVLF